MPIFINKNSYTVKAAFKTNKNLITPYIIKLKIYKKNSINFDMYIYRICTI